MYLYFILRVIVPQGSILGPLFLLIEQKRAAALAACDFKPECGSVGFYGEIFNEIKMQINFTLYPRSSSRNPVIFYLQLQFLIFTRSKTTSSTPLSNYLSST